jgi:hypothetical protein
MEKGGVGSGSGEDMGELRRRDHVSSWSRLLLGRGEIKVKGEGPGLGPKPGRELVMERSTMLEGGDGQSRLVPKASRLD